MNRKLKFTSGARAQYERLAGNKRFESLLKQVRKTLGYLETNPQHPGLHTHKYNSLIGYGDEDVFEAYAQNRTPGAYRVFWHYGPDEVVAGKRVSVITILAITPHP